MNLAVFLIFLSSFIINDKVSSEYTELQKLEYRALRHTAGNSYVYNLTGRKDCNKTRVNYLGTVKTRKGKRYKILTSFFVYSASATCHGTSSIKIFDMKNRYIGEYNVGMPDGLPDILKDNKLLYIKNSIDCNLRRTGSINLRNGLPENIFIPCSKNGGDLYYFSSLN